jgi:hypothetical protein
MPMLEGRVDAVIGVDTHATATPPRCWTPTAASGPPWRCQATRPVMLGFSGWLLSRHQAGGSGRLKGLGATGQG